MSPTKKIKVEDVEITIFEKPDQNDFICITDIVKLRTDDARAADIIKNWLRTRSTIEFLGTWEALYNPSFKVVEFDHFRKEKRGRSSYVYAQRQQLDRKDRCYRIGVQSGVASISELVVMVNLESMNATLIKQGLGRRKRYEILSEIAQSQLQSLNNADIENRFMAIDSGDPKLLK